MRHEIPIHLVPGSALVPVEIELLKGGEQEVLNGLLEDVVHLSPNELHTACEATAEIFAAWLG